MEFGTALLVCRINRWKIFLTLLERVKLCWTSNTAVIDLSKGKRVQVGQLVLILYNCNTLTKLVAHWLLSREQLVVSLYYVPISSLLDATNDRNLNVVRCLN